MTHSAAALLSAPLQQPSRQELAAASRVTYVLHQRFRYHYDAPVRDVNHRLVVVPRREHGGQRRRLQAVTVMVGGTPHPAATTTRPDRAGNTVTRARVRLVPDEIEFIVAAVVERAGSAVDVLLPAAARNDPRLLRPTRLTAADAAIRDLAAAMSGPDPVATAERFCGYVHEAISYEYGVTSVTTTAAEALAGGRGVCQDSAHVMIALCRAAALPARYVSGHLLGEGGTHAWVEVVVPDPAGARAVAFDPCNGRRAGKDYLTVATGRDYADVAPTSGTYSGTGRGTLTATKRVGVALVAQRE
jgi:transglutaminase-like putative cysteine protease